MAVNSSSSNRRTTSRRTRRTTKKDTDDQSPAELTPTETTETKSVEAETKTAENEKESDTQQEKLDVATKSTQEGNSAPTQIQVSQPNTMIHNRPVEHSNWEVAGMLTANRPIAKANHTTSVTLIQPEDAAGVMANRPIAATQLQISSMVMNRPIASNDIDDPDLLMGYLD
jgi:hypothetical protein